LAVVALEQVALAELITTYRIQAAQVAAVHPQIAALLAQLKLVALEPLDKATEAVTLLTCSQTSEQVAVAALEQLAELTRLSSAVADRAAMALPRPLVAYPLIMVAVVLAADIAARL